jgi:hypothetical protein
LLQRQRQTRLLEGAGEEEGVLEEGVRHFRVISNQYSVISAEKTDYWSLITGIRDRRPFSLSTSS